MLNKPIPLADVYIVIDMKVLSTQISSWPYIFFNCLSLLLKILIFWVYAIVIDKFRATSVFYAPFAGSGLRW